MSRAIRRDKRRRERHYVDSERHLLQVDEPAYSNRLRREHRRGLRHARKQIDNVVELPELESLPLGAAEAPSTEVAF